MEKWQYADLPQDSPRYQYLRLWIEINVDDYMNHDQIEGAIDAANRYFGAIGDEN